MDNGSAEISDTKSIITISVYPAEKGFACAIVEPKIVPLTAEFSIALTIAHGMIKMALEQPDIIFDAGIEALSHPIENDTVVSIEDMVHRKKDKLH
tara:strand:+ start:649 stop:936 length:288 start_codon:yes stop_codon:yes gene_type:complete